MDKAIYIPLLYEFSAWIDKGIKELSYTYMIIYIM